MSLTYYDIYGFVLAVDAGMKKAFDLEYWRFATKTAKKVDLFVKKAEKKGLPVRLRMDTKGISLPFGPRENTVWYEPGVPGDWVLYTIEPFLRWKDKCFLHCGAVAKDGAAIVFPAASGVGKTTMAMHLTGKGYAYLADDWLIVGQDGKAYPFYKTVHVFDYNLKDKEVAKKVLGSKRMLVSARINALKLVERLFPHRFVRIFVDRFMPIFSVDIEKLHPGTKVGVTTDIKRVYWLQKDEKAGRPYLRKGDVRKLAERMPYITALEQEHFYRNYLEWVYDSGAEKEFESRIAEDQKIMKKAFSKAEVWTLFVPENVNPRDVEDLIKEHE